MGRPLGSGSFAAIFGSLIGTSTTASHIESAAGIAAGGRTGLTAVVVALCFLLALSPASWRAGSPRSNGTM